ncbi:Protein melted-like protein [Aphelenchoides fujianensis]|nr:Protein melted-like protein [Aphelenchoides fujianensis]
MSVEKSPPSQSTHPPAHGTLSTCSVLGRVLQRRQLQAADELFLMNDFEVISEVHGALETIKGLLNEPTYSTNEADQQVVELVFSRIRTAAINESSTVESIAAPLVDLVESALLHRVSSGSSDTPHQKILVEVLSTLFLFHSKRLSPNQDLVRNSTAYLSLAAVHNARLLSSHSVQLIGFALKGNRALASRPSAGDPKPCLSELEFYLVQIYAENREPFHAHLTPLLGLLLEDAATETAEKLALLQLLHMIINGKPELVVPHLDRLDSFLFDPATCSTTLKLFTSLINQGRTDLLVGQLIALRRAAQQPNCSQQNLGVLLQIFARIAKTSEQMSTVAAADAQLAHGLREVEGLSEIYPHAVLPHIEVIREVAEKNPTSYGVYTRIKTITSEALARRDDLPGHLLPNVLDSVESLGALSKRSSSRAFPSDPFHLVPEDVVAEELDRNTKNLVDSYRLRSTGSLVNALTIRTFRTRTRRSKERRPLHDIRSPPTNRHSPTPPLRCRPSRSFRTSNWAEDGRVRPITARPTQQKANWKTPDHSASNVSSTTTFPVLDRLPARGHALSGSQVRMVDEHVAKSRSQSMRSSRANSAAAAEAAGWEARGDLVRQFVDSRRSKISRFVSELAFRHPIPVKCTVEGGGKRSNNKMRIHFACQTHGPNCVFSNVDRLFAIKTKQPASWLHLMFLHVEVAHLHLTGQVLAQDSAEYKNLAACWECLPKEVTRSQPYSTLRQQKALLNELQDARLFDSFFFDAAAQKWQCVACSYPNRVNTLLNSQGLPFLEGRLKERKGSFWFWKRWTTRYCTVFSPGNRRPQFPPPDRRPAADRRVEQNPFHQGRKHRKALPRAFEIFTEDDQTFVFKSNDRKSAADWVQSLQIAVAAQRRS